MTPGATFRMWVAARVPEQSLGNVRVDLIFLGTSSTETSRVALALVPVRTRLGSTVLEPDGTYSISVSAERGTAYRLVAEYVGDESHWPARARVEVAVR